MRDTGGFMPVQRAGVEAKGRGALRGLLAAFDSGGALALAGGLFLVLSAAVNWLYVPIEGPVRGLSIPLFGAGVAKGGGPNALSFGALVGALGLLGLIASVRRAAYPRIFAGVGAFLAAVYFIHKFSVTDLAVIERMAGLNAQQSNINNFTDMNLPLNRGVEPLYTSAIATDGLKDRVNAVWHFTMICWGWEFAVAGAALLAAGGLAGKGAHRGGLGARMAVMGASAALPIAYLGYAMAAPEYHQRRGDDHLAEGLYNSAVEEYSAALRINPALRFNSRFRHNRGAAFFNMDRRDAADYHLYRAGLLVEEEKVPDALDEYRIAASMDADGVVIRKRWAEVLVGEGLRQFNANKARFTAIAHWETALEIDADQPQAHYFLAKAYFDVSQYRAAVSENMRFLKMSKNPILNANSYANIGDCRLMLKDIAAAREGYEASQRSDRYRNYRAGKSLGGT
jgi:tetratricopeptide (TPR) repeat protein